jgi:DMSO/TMAO reductase YedYZ molybdopterin-dependent catalytic subunit
METMNARYGVVLTFICLLVVLTGVLTGCAAPAPEAAPAVTPVTPAPASTVSAPCALPPLVVPTPPARIPAYLELDPATNLHMTGSVQYIDVASYRLVVKGRVDRPLSFTYDDLRCLPKKQMRSLLVCPGFFQDMATWAGAPLDVVLAMAGVQAGSTQVLLISADGYATTLPLQNITPDKNDLLAYEWEGQPLPIVHGFPVRAVLPGESGGSWVKWLVALEVQ